MVELLNAANRARTALSGAITATATSFSVEDASSFPKPPFAITVEDEIMEVGTVSGNTFSNVTRGLEGTVAVAHEQGAPVENRFTAGTYNRMVDSFNEQKVKVIKVEQELNNFKTTLQQININQEAKQKVSGYDIITIPKNAAEGQVSDIVVKGLTATNLVKNGSFEYGAESWTNIGGYISIDTTKSYTGLKSIKQDLIDSAAGPRQTLNLIVGHKYYFSSMMYISAYTSGSPRMRLANQSISIYANRSILNQWQRLSVIMDSTVSEDRITFETPGLSTFTAFIDAVMAIDLTATFGAGNEPTKEQCDKIFPNWFDSTKSTVSAIRLTSKNEDETEQSTQYITAKDEEGKIAELRSLPNGTKDEIRVSENKLIKRIGDKTNVASGTVIDYSDMAENGTYYAWNEDGETETGIKGDTLGIDATTLTYQLATPIEIPIQTSGTLVSYPSGTVYIEPFVADAGIYADKMEVLYSDLPIKALEKISKVDFDTGLETELDITAAVIAEDKLSFIHPDLVEGDIVFFVYEHGAEGTIPETEISYYDSRYVIKGEDDKFYQWEIEAKLVEGVITPSIKLVEV